MTTADDSKISEGSGIYEFSKDDLCTLLISAAEPWNALSPFAEDLSVLAPTGNIPGPPLTSSLARVALVLARPDVCITHCYAGASVAPGGFTTCAKRTETNTFVVIEALQDDRYSVRVFCSLDAYLEWWVALLSSPAENPIPKDLPPTLPLPAMVYALHAVDAYRRAKEQSLLSHGPADSLQVKQAEFAATMIEAVERRDLRCLLPSFLYLTPGVIALLKEPPQEPRAMLEEAEFLRPRRDPVSGQGVFIFGGSAQRMGTEFSDGITVAVGFGVEVWTEQEGPLPLIEAFLAPTRLTNRLIQIEPDASGFGMAKHQALTQRELYITLFEMVAVALHPDAPKVALKRALLMAAPTQAQRPATVDPSNKQKADVASAQKTSSQIVCSHCGQANPATMKFCGECGNRLSPQTSVLPPAKPAAALKPLSRPSAPQGPTVTARQWFRTLSVVPRVHYRFRYDPADARRLIVVEHPGRLPKEILLEDVAQVLFLAQLLRRIRDEKLVSEEEFKALHAALLRVRDADGAIWTVGLGSLRWSRLEQGRWVPAEAPEMVWLDLDLLQAAVRRMPSHIGSQVIHVAGAEKPNIASPPVQAQSCRACGKPVRAGAKFCTSCGATIATSLPQGEEILFELPERKLKRLLDLVQYAREQSDRRPINGLLMVVDSQELQLVATDGHRLAIAAHPVNLRQASSRKIVLARDTVIELTESLAQRDTPVVIEVSPSRIRFWFSGGRSLAATAQLPEPEFPTYQSIVSSPRPNVMRVGRQSLAQALQRVSGGESVEVHWALDGSRLVINRAAAVDHGVQEQLPITYRGGSLRVDFNARYLLDVLTRLDCDQVEVALGGTLSSALITVPGRQDFKYVVMPVRGE
ncbi:DNA polymerase III subunit beta family protein [Methylobacter sp. YRD-M1]|uniref:DNA polymerase III subunit beta family protein n=1 Tax=Methylobacter sp. YRD-M1 TaxID=2911520 RepID=UPI00227B5F5D|nr:zinc-ribbon domain-containing protein [Methylobacter sp. YRD-M1]WAK02099.1 hypothetical protein LZ558_20165 [Methylobacter sp. YRD-M1]